MGRALPPSPAPLRYLWNKTESTRTTFGAIPTKVFSQQVLNNKETAVPSPPISLVCVSPQPDQWVLVGERRTERDEGLVHGWLKGGSVRMGEAAAVDLALRQGRVHPSFGGLPRKASHSLGHLRGICWNAMTLPPRAR